MSARLTVCCSVGLPLRETTWRLLFAILLSTFAGVPAGAGEFPNTQEETIPPLSPQQALEAIRVPEGFRVSLFAAEPDVQNPIAMTTDSRGRLWVVENYTYAESSVNFDLTLSDRIVILEDTDGDGVHDERTVFWDQGKQLTSIEVGFGGVFVAAAPYLLFLPDRDQDDVPDGEPEILLEGFDNDSVRHNIVNGLKWGPDGWLYGRHGIQATSRVGVAGASDAERVPLNCSVWRYHPTRRTFEVIAHGTTNPWGMDWDEHGECWLINTVIGHLWHVIPGVHWKRMYGSDFDPHLYGLIEQTADHVHWAEGETWTDVRKEMSATTSAAGGGHAHSGLLACDRTWPAEYRGSLLAGNLHGRRLNRDRLERKGCSYTAVHEPDFLFSDDPYFRVIEMVHARGRGIYVADWSDIGECHENDGVHRSSGRIFKVTWDEPEDLYRAEAVPDGDHPLAQEGKRFPVPAAARHAADLATLSNAQLVSLQRSYDEWTARTALRLLQERAAAGESVDDAVAALDWMIEADKSTVHTLRAMWSLFVMGELTSDRIRPLLAHGDEHVRAWGVRLLGDVEADQSVVVDVLCDVAMRDGSGLVRLYIASALQQLPIEARMSLADALLQWDDDAHDRQQPLMIWYGIEPAVAANTEWATRVAVSSKIPLIAQFIARRLAEEIERQSHGVNGLVARLPDVDAARQREILTGLNTGLAGWRRAPRPAGWDDVAALLAKSDNDEVVRLARELAVVFGDGRAMDQLRGIAADGNADDSARVAAIEALVEARVEELAELLTGLLNDRKVAAAAIRGLAVVGGEDAAKRIADHYRRFHGLARDAAVSTLCSRPDFAPVLLAAVSEGRIPAEDVPAFQLRQLLTAGSDEIRERIRTIWPSVQPLAGEKQARIAELRTLLDDESLVDADASRGRLLYRNACGKCHKLFGEGGTTAPDLTGSQRSNLMYLLENIVDPSATLAENYRMSIVQLDDGRILNGVITGDTGRTISLQTESEQIVIDKQSVELVKATELSLMPEGQLDRLSVEEIRSLFRYLMSPHQVPLPANAAE